MHPFLEPDLVQRDIHEQGVSLSDSVVAAAIAALTTGKHLLLNGGNRRSRAALARALARAGVSAERSIGYIEAHMATAIGDRSDRQLVDWGSGTLRDAAEFSCWLILFDVDLWPFSDSGLARAFASRRRITQDSWRLLLTSAGLARRPLDPAWREIASEFAWIDVADEGA